MPTASTDVLEIAYEESGPSAGPPVLLLHGWPDSPRGLSAVAGHLATKGYRTITPYLRGFGPTRFRSPDALRDGRSVALAKDALDLADALGIERFDVVGHDWGGRTAYTLAALWPERVTSIAALALAFQPHAKFSVPTFGEARLWWYQWFMTTEGGAEAVGRDPVGFAHIQWDTWSPPGWFDEAEFAETAKAFTNPDWAAVTLSAYRSRWRPETLDDRYASLADKLTAVGHLSTPTLMIQGEADTCDPATASEGLEACFTGPYRRLVLPGVGHFPAREAPGLVAEWLLEHFAALPG
jgi:pimeloyl-ACP methyl ester carboxylesterase